MFGLIYGALVIIIYMARDNHSEVQAELEKALGEDSLRASLVRSRNHQLLMSNHHVSR